ncbi:methyltransferase domain-containing protein [Paenibacillus larvae]
MRVDLGCGLQKHPDTWGLDKVEYSGVDAVCDFNKGIPLEDQSVDFLLAAHSLQYANDLMFVMEEIYRVCKHKAVVCILAPYANNGYHQANPYYRYLFNEHTPRYLTRDIYEVAEYGYKKEPLSAFNPNPSLIIDFRLIRQEFFYMPEYATPLYEEEDRIILRQSQLNVVDEIMFHFAVIKEPISKEELGEMSRRNLEEPVAATFKRYSGHSGELLKIEQQESPAREESVPLHRTRAAAWGSLKPSGKQRGKRRSFHTRQHRRKRERVQKRME